MEILSSLLHSDRSMMFVRYIHKDEPRLGPSFKLNRIRFLLSLKDIIGFVKSFYEARAIDVLNEKYIS